MFLCPVIVFIALRVMVHGAFSTYAALLVIVIVIQPTTQSIRSSHAIIHYSRIARR
jgi:uncharacterized membrane protein